MDLFQIQIRLNYLKSHVHKFPDRAAFEYTVENIIQIFNNVSPGFFHCKRHLFGWICIFP